MSLENLPVKIIYAISKFVPELEHLAAVSFSLMKILQECAVDEFCRLSARPARNYKLSNLLRFYAWCVAGAILDPNVVTYSLFSYPLQHFRLVPQSKSFSMATFVGMIEAMGISFYGYRKDRMLETATAVGIVYAPARNECSANRINERLVSMNIWEHIEKIFIAKPAAAFSDYRAYENAHERLIMSCLGLQYCNGSIGSPNIWAKRVLYTANTYAPVSDCNRNVDPEWALPLAITYLIVHGIEKTEKQSWLDDAFAAIYDGNFSKIAAARYDEYSKLYQHRLAELAQWRAEHGFEFFPLEKLNSVRKAYVDNAREFLCRTSTQKIARCIMPMIVNNFFEPHLIPFSHFDGTLQYYADGELKHVPEPEGIKPIIF